MGATVRFWVGDEAIPRANNSHVVVDHALLGSAVLHDAASTRFDDHRSYFTMLFDHTHDVVTVDERRRSFAWMAKDLDRLTQEHATVDALRQAISIRRFDSGSVDRRLR